MADQALGMFHTVLAYCSFILLGPIVTFFFTKVFVFETIFGSSGVGSNVWSAVAAVIVLHVALAMYLYRAYYVDSEKPEKEAKVD